MLYIAAQLDQSLDVAHSTPQFAPVALFDTLSGDNRETNLITAPDRDFGATKPTMPSGLRGAWLSAGGTLKGNADLWTASFNKGDRIIGRKVDADTFQRLVVGSHDATDCKWNRRK